MDIKASINIKEGGKVESVNFSIKENKEVTNINFKMSPTPISIRVMNISREAYNYMVGKENPSFIKKTAWVTMSKTKKFEAHINRIAENFGGEIVDYQVFED